MKKELLKQFKLPGYLNSDSFAGDSEILNKKFESRTGIAEQKTKEELLARIAKAQEYVKMQEALAANATQVPDMMEGQVPAGMEEFMPQQNQALFGGMFGEEGLEAAGGVEGIAGGVADIAGSLIGGGNKIDTSGAQSYDAQGAKNARTQGAVGGGIKAATGALTGNPLDFGLGLFEVGKSLIGGKKEQEEMNQANVNSNLASTANLRSDFAYGGKMNSYAEGGDPTDPRDPYSLSVNYNTTSQPTSTGQPWGNYFNLNNLDLGKYGKRAASTGDPLASTVDMTGAGSNLFTSPDYSATSSEEESKTGAGKVLDWLGKNGGEIARLAPIFGNLTNKLERPTTEAASKVIGRYARKPRDLQRSINQINQATNETGMAAELSGGDMGAARNMATVLDLNTKKAISDASAKDQMAEQQDEQFGTTIDQRNAQFNSMQDERYIDRKARDQGAYNTAKQAQRNALYEDIGLLGKETADKQTVQKMFGYKWNGEYWTDNKGNKMSDADVQVKVKEMLEKQKEQKTNMFGGFLKR